MQLALIVLAVAIVAPLAASGAELRVLSTLNIRPALDALQSDYERASGNHVVFDSKGAAATEARIGHDEPGDVAIHARPTLERLLRRGKVEGAITDVAHASIGVVVTAGAPHPDISSNEAFRGVMLDAKSLTYPDPKEGSLGGNYLAHLFREWNIAGELAPKLTLAAGGAPAAQLVAQGKVQYGLNQIAEFLNVKGVEFLMPLPPVLKGKVVMAAALLPHAKDPKAAADFIRFLASPAAAAALEAHGMTP